jgi:hypothetical protein
MLNVLRMSDTDFIDDGGLFGHIPKTAHHFDPHAVERQRERERREAAERAEREERLKNLPSREELALKLMDIAESRIAIDQRLKAMHLYAQVMGYLDNASRKKSGGDEGPKIMPVPVASSDEEWQKHAASYSQKLEKIVRAS